jgi:hypothetical protein
MVMTKSLAMEKYARIVTLVKSVLWQLEKMAIEKS